MRRSWYPGWTALATINLAQIGTVGMAIFAFATLALPMAQHFGVSLTQIMALPMLLKIGLVVCAPVAGILYDRFPARAVALGGLLAFICGLVVLGVAQAFWQVALVFATTMVSGLLLAGPMAGQVFAARWFIRRRGAALSVALVGASLGGFFVPILVAQLLVGRSVSDVWLILALIWAVLLLPAAFFGLRRNPTPELLAAEEIEGSTKESAPAAVKLPWLAIVTNRNFIVVTSSMVVAMVCVLGLQFHLVSIAHDHGYSLTQGAALLSACAISTLAAKFGWALIVDRMEARMAFVAAALMLCGGVVLNMFEAYPLMVAGTIALGAGSAGIMPVMGIMLTREFGVAAIGQVLSLAYTVLNLDFATPLLIGALRESSGSYQLPLAILAGLCVLAMATIMLFRERPVEAGKRLNSLSAQE